MSYYFDMLILRGLETKRHLGGSDQLKAVPSQCLSEAQDAVWAGHGHGVII